MKALLILAGMLLMASCTAAPTSVRKDPGIPLISLDREQNGSAVVLRPGGVLRIALPGDPNAGYLWELNPLDQKVLVQSGHALYVPHTDVSLSGGIFYFTFTGVSAGVTPLRLVYRQIHGKDTSPAKNFLVLVTVQP